MEIFFLRGGLEKSDSMQCYQRTVRSWAKRLEILMRSDQIQQAVLFRKKVRAVLSSVRFEAKAVAELPSGQISHLYRTVSLLFSEAPELLYTKVRLHLIVDDPIVSVIFPERKSTTALENSRVSPTVRFLSFSRFSFTRKR